MEANWKKLAGFLGLALGSLLLCLAGVLSLARQRWSRRSARREARLLRGRGASPPVALSGAKLDSAPEPVNRHLRRALRDRQPVIRGARLSQRGEFLVNPARGAWRTFRAHQTVSVEPPGFVWDARIRMAPGASIHVRDSFVEGTGGMHANALGHFPMVSVAPPGAGAIRRDNQARHGRVSEGRAQDRRLLPPLLLPPQLPDGRNPAG